MNVGSFLNSPFSAQEQSESANAEEDSSWAPFGSSLTELLSPTSSVPPDTGSESDEPQIGILNRVSSFVETVTSTASVVASVAVDSYQPQPLFSTQNREDNPSDVGLTEAERAAEREWESLRADLLRSSGASTWLDVQVDSSHLLHGPAASLVLMSGVAPSLRRELWLQWSGGAELRARQEEAPGHALPRLSYFPPSGREASPAGGNAPPAATISSIPDSNPAALVLTCPSGEWPATAAGAPSPEDLAEWAETIQKDVERTCCCVPYFRDGDGPTVLSRLLLAFARWCPGVGYVQGMASLAAVILLVFQGGGCAGALREDEEDEGKRGAGGHGEENSGSGGVTGADTPQSARRRTSGVPLETTSSTEEEAFWCFAGVVTQRLEGYFDEGMPSLTHDTRVLSALVFARARAGADSRGEEAAAAAASAASSNKSEKGGVEQGGDEEEATTRARAELAQAAALLATCDAETGKGSGRGEAAVEASGFDFLLVTPDWFLQMFADSLPPAVCLHVWDLVLWHRQPPNHDRPSSSSASLSIDGVADSPLGERTVSTLGRVVLLWVALGVVRSAVGALSDNQSSTATRDGGGDGGGEELMGAIGALRETALRAASLADVTPPPPPLYAPMSPLSPQPGLEPPSFPTSSSSSAAAAGPMSLLAEVRAIEERLRRAAAATAGGGGRGRSGSNGASSRSSSRSGRKAGARSQQQQQQQRSAGTGSTAVTPDRTRGRAPAGDGGGGGGGGGGAPSRSPSARASQMPTRSRRAARGTVHTKDEPNPSKGAFFKMNFM